MDLTKSSMTWLSTNLLSALVNFIAVIYFTRSLGASALGVYFLFVSVLNLFVFVSNMGLSPATIKRISEGKNLYEYFTASFLSRLMPSTLIVIIILTNYNYLNNYIGARIAVFLAIFLIITHFSDLIRETLHGMNRVGTGGVFDFSQQAAKAAFQVLFVFIGAGILGMLVGLGAGILASIALGIALVHPVFSMPNRSHYKSLFNFSKFSFGNAIGGYIYEWAGIAIIGYFLSRQSVGVYGVVWGLSLIFMLLSQSIANVIYPKISNLSANGKKEEVKTIFFDGFIYSPMVAIPAFAGVLFISENLLNVMYGEEFKTGSLVLIILMLGRIFQSFQIISVRTLEGIDRPDFVFKVNAVTTVLNLASTFIFVYLFGIAGAAISATLTILVSFLWNTNIVCRTLNVKIPWNDIVPQMLSAAIMGAAVSGISKLLPQATIQNLIIVILAGGAVYFAVLLSLSKRIKSKCLLIIKEVTHPSSGAVEI